MLRSFSAEPTRQPSLHPPVFDSSVSIAVLAILVAITLVACTQPVDNATIANTVGDRMRAAFPVQVLCPNTHPQNDFGPAADVRGTTIRVVVERSAIRETPNKLPATRATVVVSGSTTIIWGIGGWRRPAPPSRCDFNTRMEVLLRKDDFGALRAFRCANETCDELLTRPL